MPRGVPEVIVELLSPLRCKIRLSFEISLLQKDLVKFYRIQSLFGVGKVSLRSNRNLCVYRVRITWTSRRVCLLSNLVYTLPLLWSRTTDLRSDPAKQGVLGPKERLKRVLPNLRLLKRV
jgi:hypothetical protein